MTMIEKVAGAIMRAYFSRPFELQSINVSVIDQYDLAKAAIEAMRESEEMIKILKEIPLYADEYFNDDEAKQIINEMIDAALKE